MTNKICNKIVRMHDESLRKFGTWRYEAWRKSLEKKDKLEQESYQKFDTCKHRGLRYKNLGFEGVSFPYCKTRDWRGLSLREILTRDVSTAIYFKSNFQPSVTCGKCRLYEEKSNGHD